jgi:hypothetical protein
MPSIVCMLLESLRARVAGDGRKTDERSSLPSVRPTALLQAELMRFEGRFTARLVAAFAPLIASDDLTVRLRAAEDELRFLSSALDIAVSAHPELNLVDMVALVALGRDAMTQRWDVTRYGDDSRAIERSFERSLDDISTFARSVVSGDVEAEVRRVIEQWRAENPDLVEVEAVRLSTYVAERASTLEKHAPSVIRLMHQAAHTADDAVLLGERALYAAQRLPFLVRKQARVGSSELLVDLARNLDSVELPLTAANARFVLDALGKLRDVVASAEKPLGTVAGMVRSDALQPLAAESGLLVDKITALIHELAAALGEGRGSDAAVRVRSLGRGVEHSLDRLLFKTFLTCSGIAVVTASAWLIAQVARQRLSTHG